MEIIENECIQRVMDRLEAVDFHAQIFRLLKIRQMVFQLKSSKILTLRADANGHSVLLVV